MIKWILRSRSGLLNILWLPWMLLSTPLSTLTLCMLFCCKMRCLSILCPRSICKSFAKAYASSTRTEYVHSFPILRQANLRSSLCMHTTNSSLYPFSKNSWNWMHSKELYWFLHPAHHILGHGRTVPVPAWAHPRCLGSVCQSQGFSCYLQTICTLRSTTSTLSSSGLFPWARPRHTVLFDQHTLRKA